MVVGVVIALEREVDTVMASKDVDTHGVIMVMDVVMVMVMDMATGVICVNKSILRLLKHQVR